MWPVLVSQAHGGVCVWLLVAAVGSATDVHGGARAHAIMRRMAYAAGPLNLASYLNLATVWYVREQYLKLAKFSS